MEKNKQNDKKKLFSFFGFANFFNQKKIVQNDKEVLAEHSELLKNEKKLRKVKADNSQNKWSALKTLKTDLIKNEVTVFFDWKKNLLNFLVNFVVVCFVIFLIYVGLVIWSYRSENKTVVIDEKTNNLLSEIIKLDNELKDLDTLRLKIQIVSNLLAQHIYWTNFFDFLEKNTLANVHYSSSFSGNTSGTYSFGAHTDDFYSMAEQIKVLKENKNVIKVLSDGGNSVASRAKNKDDDNSSDNSSVSFTINISLNPNIFKNNYGN